MPIENDIDTLYGLTDDELTRRFKESIRIDNEIRKIKGLPVAKYDREAGKAASMQFGVEQLS